MYTHGICQQVPKQQVQVQVLRPQVQVQVQVLRPQVQVQIQVLQTCTQVQLEYKYQVLHVCLFFIHTQCTTTMLLRALAAASTIPYT